MKGVGSLQEYSRIASRIAEDIAKSIRLLRRLQSEKTVENGSLADFGKESDILEGGSLSRAEWFGEVIRGKIQLTYAIGGDRLVREVSLVLEESPDEPKYHFVSAYSALADRIGEWLA